MFSFTLCTVLASSFFSKLLIMFARVCNVNDAPCARYVRNNLFSELCILGSAGVWLQSASRRHCCRTYRSRKVYFVCLVLSRILICFFPIFFLRPTDLLVFFRPMSMWGYVYVCICVLIRYTSCEIREHKYFSADNCVNKWMLLGIQNSELAAQNIEITFENLHIARSKNKAERFEVLFCSENLYFWRSYFLQSASQWKWFL